MQPEDRLPNSAFTVYKKKSHQKNQNIKKKQIRLKATLKSDLQTIKKRKRIQKKTKPKIKNEEKPSAPVEVTSIKSEANMDEQPSPSSSAGLTNGGTVEERNATENLVPRSSTPPDPLTEVATLFKWLISPLSPETFFRMYWEHKPVHIERTNKNYYKHILDSSSLDKIIRNNPLYFTRNVDVVSYENGVKQVYNQEGRATPSALWDYYSNGCSVRILNPQTYSQKVHLLIATLQEYFGTMVGVNVYLTPPGSQGFAPHFDDIEAFVVQLEGRKHWKLYQPKDSEVLARCSSGNFRHEEIGVPFMQLTLTAGEVLYFPRGTIHEGCTDEDSHSLHITVSVYQRTCYADLLQHVLPDALKRAAEDDVEFRRGLPVNYLKSFGVAANFDESREAVLTKVGDLMRALVQYMDVDGAADQLGRKFMRDSMPPVPAKSELERMVKADGPYLKEGKVINRVEINLGTKVRLLRYYCMRLVKEDGVMPRLYYSTENATVYQGEEEQWLELEDSMVPLIQMLQSSYPNYVEIDELPMEDVAVKMQLVSDLWEHGLLVTEHPLEVIG